MSFLPAEELDDFDSDDGFMGDEDFHQTYSNRPNSVPTQVTSASSSYGFTEHEQRPTLQHSPSSNSCPSTTARTDSQPRRPFGFQTGPSRNGFDAYRPHQAFFSDEDMKIGAIKGNTELIKKCLNQGIPVDQPFHSGWTALMYASNNANAAVVSYLLSQEADVNCHSDMYTALMCACSSTVPSEEDILECSTILINAGAEINAKDRYHSTPLMLASRAGKVETVKLLLEKGAKVNDQDSRGWTALTMATQKSHKMVVMTLLDAGADCNIKHMDKLTVKDLAAHLPTDEMLALLERRPFIASKYGDDVNAVPLVTASNHCLLEAGGDVSMKSTDLRYGELELFLYGLDLPHLLPLLRKHLIDLPRLLTLTELDLTNAGVEQVGARKKILDACQAVHKRHWEASSLVSIHFNKRISCADAVAMIANISKHLRYIASTSTYVKEQIKKHPDTVMQPTDRVNPTQLMRHVEDSVKNVDSLKDQLLRLQSQLTKEMPKNNINPPDLVTFEKRKWRTSSKLKSLGALCIVFGAAYVVYCKRDKLLDFVC